MVAGDGVEPPRPWLMRPGRDRCPAIVWSLKRESNPRPSAYRAAALASELFRRKWWTQSESNRRHSACRAGALPTELWARKGPGRLDLRQLLSPRRDRADVLLQHELHPEIGSAQRIRTSMSLINSQAPYQSTSAEKIRMSLAANARRSRGPDGVSAPADDR